ncbi:hypothetical protein E4U44_003267 [Claviceps purpurea]|nr:hypothetical protein E4U45_005974 [Claviceps purpurea]KAG6312523.1 hypothetical protein E4U44_003267 [Claviceps purpurea]
MKTSLVLSTIVGAGLVAATDCPAAGLTDSQGRSSCNPAHQQAEGRQCKQFDTCHFLCDTSGNPIISNPTSGAASACPAAGLTDSQGRYSCNPAHKQAEGRQCKQFDACYFLSDTSGKPVISNPTSGAASACPAAGLTDSQGRYSCNPAHKQAEGRQCKQFDACYFLSDTNGKPVISNPTSVVAPGAAQPTSACPAPGFTDSKGRYSCNPAHKYPEGQQCKEIDGCLFLCGADGQPVMNQPGSTETGSGSNQPASTETGSGSNQPASTETGSGSNQPGSTETGPSMPNVTAGAATLSGAGLLGLVGLAIALF